jgi:hypothetical protein
MFVNLSIICLHFELDQSDDFDTASSNAGSERGKHVSDLLKTQGFDRTHLHIEQWCESFLHYFGVLSQVC